MKNQITKSSTAEYFSKNLQQVGFSSPTKAVLTTLKEAVDNSLDACEEAGIAPSLKIRIEKKGRGSSRNTDLIVISVEDNGPGLDIKDIPKVFGEYLASSKFGRGRCSRGQQGIGISAATTWAQLTNAAGAQVISKTKGMKKAISLTVDMDIKNNKGLIKDKKTVDYENSHGLTVKFLIDGRVQLNGEGGLITYLEGTALVNPHLSLEYQLLDQEKKTIPRVNSAVPIIPPSTYPHPHTMKLGEFLQHAGLYGAITLKKFLRTGFSRVTNKAISDMTQAGLKPDLLKKPLSRLTDKEYRDIFHIIQKTSLKNPTTQSVLIVGEEGLAESIHRLGEVDFFSVITRSPKICDYKSVVVEVALARFQNRVKDEESTIQLLRFANRVPLQFDKASCAITKAVESVNWRAYGIAQSKKSLPTGPYIFAVAVTSPFIKFKNASKETIDASDELVEEIRLALMRAGQKLKRHIRKEMSAEDLLRKKQHIEKFAPILIRKLKDITKASGKDVERAEKGLREILSKDKEAAERALGEAKSRLQELKLSMKRGGASSLSESSTVEETDSSTNEVSEQDEVTSQEIQLSTENNESSKKQKKDKRTKTQKTELKHKPSKNKKIKKTGTGKTKKLQTDKTKQLSLLGQSKTKGKKKKGRVKNAS